MIFTEKNQIAYVRLSMADAYDGNTATTCINMGKYGHCTFVLVEGAGGTGTAIITLEECTSAAGAGNVAIPLRYRLCTTNDTWGALTSVAVAATGYTTVAGVNKMVAFEVDAADLDAGYTYVRLQVTEVANSAVNACILAICSEPRDAMAIMPSAIT
jgi:hypothetical protein